MFRVEGGGAITALSHLTLGELQYYMMEFVALVLSFDSIQHICLEIIHIKNRSLFKNKNKWRVLPRTKSKRCPMVRFAPLVSFLVKLVTTTTFVVYILLHNRTISYSEPQLQDI